MDDVAPPPYSETDVFSNTNTTILTPAASTADNVSRAGRVRSNTSSTQGSVIYTPPYSPTESNYTHQGNNPSHHSAQNYFSSRPAPPSLSYTAPLQHNINLTALSTPDDLPFPQTAAVRDITFQDWATFLNYLLPDHVASVNNSVAIRKLKAELIDERMQRLTLNEHDHPRLDFNHVDAQLNHLRQSSTGAGENWESYVYDIIDVWNKGFFEPRGLKIVRSEMKNAGRVPLDQGGSPRVSRGRGFRGMNGNHHPFAGCRGRGGFRMGSVVANNEGLKIGRDGLVADNNGLRIGTSFIADNQGLRIGRFVANEHGVTFGGHTLGGGHRGNGWHGHNRWQDHGHYDRIDDQQLPAAKESLMAWLNHPEYPMTKDMIKKLKKDISSPKPDNMKNNDQDLKALRKDVKDLLKRFKEEKKSQKKIRKILMKEEKQLKKAQRKEKKNERKAERKALKLDRNGRRRDSYSGPTRGMYGFPPGIGFPFPPEPQFAPGPSFYQQVPNRSFAAIHGSWPFAPQVQSASFSQGASQIHAQASRVLGEARGIENKARDIRISLTAEGIGEKKRSKMTDEAVALEERAAILTREGERLMAEAMHLDEELARELQEDDQRG
ncbi:hypothetical protein ACMFMG_009061 [Clarireedia jacksonii]